MYNLAMPNNWTFGLQFCTTEVNEVALSVFLFMSVVLCLCCCIFIIFKIQKSLWELTADQQKQGHCCFFSYLNNATTPFHELMLQE